MSVLPQFRNTTRSQVVEGAFQEALRNFKSRLSATDLRAFSCVTSDDVQVLAIKLEKDETMRRSHQALGLVQPFIDGLASYAGVIEVFTQTSEILAFVWGPIKFLLQVTSKWQKSLDTLLAALAGVGEKFLIFGKCGPLIKVDDRFDKVIVRAYADLMDLLWLAMKIFRKEGFQQFFEIQSPFFDKKLKEVLSKLEHDSRLIETATTVVNFEQAYEFYRQANAKFAADAQHRAYLTLQILRQDLAPAFLSSKALEDAQKIAFKFAGTGDWFMNHPTYVNWKDWSPNSSRVLVLHGIPGAGKTTLSSLAFNKLQEQTTNIQTRSHLSHLSLSSESGKNDECLPAFRSLLYDELAKKVSLAETVLEHLGGEHAQKLQSIDTVQTMLEHAFRLYTHNLLFIDGLDELKDDQNIKEFLKVIDSLLKNCSNLRIFLSCRLEDAINTGLKALVPEAITISDTLNSHDIYSYTTHHQNMDVLTNQYGFDTKTAGSYLGAIASQSKGMFLYAKLIVNELPHQSCSQEIEELIAHLPKGLDEAYDRSLQRVKRLPKKQFKRAKRVFKFLLAARRKVRASELKQAIMVEPCMTAFVPGRELRCSLLYLCGSLLDVSDEEDVSLVHISLRKYLLEYDMILELRCGAIHETMARISWEFFYLETLTIVDREEYLKRLVQGEYVFLSYASQFFNEHLRLAMENHNGSHFEPVTEVLPSNAEKFRCKLMDCIQNGRVENLQSLGSKIPYMRLTNKSSKPFQGCGVISPRDLSSTFGDARLLGAFQDIILAKVEKLNEMTGECLKDCDLATSRLIRKLYGPLYKCYDRKCIYFFKGFDLRKELSDHEKMHERRNKCSDPGCISSEIGFASPQELKAHIRDEHTCRTPGKDPSQTSIVPAILQNAEKKPSQEITILIRRTKDAIVANDTTLAIQFLQALILQFQDRDGMSAGMSSGTRAYLTKNFNPGAFNFAWKNIFCYGKREFLEPKTLFDYIYWYGNIEILRVFRVLNHGYNHSSEIKIKLGLVIAIMARNVELVEEVLENRAEFDLRHSHEAHQVQLLSKNHPFCKIAYLNEAYSFHSLDLSLIFMADWTGDARITDLILEGVQSDQDLRAPGNEVALDQQSKLKKSISKTRFILDLQMNDDQLENNPPQIEIAQNLTSEEMKFLLTMASLSLEESGRFERICERLEKSEAPFWSVDAGSIIKLAIAYLDCVDSRHNVSIELVLKRLTIYLSLGVRPCHSNTPFNTLEILTGNERRADSHSSREWELRMANRLTTILELGIHGKHYLEQSVGAADDDCFSGFSLEYGLEFFKDDGSDERLVREIKDARISSWKHYNRQFLSWCRRYFERDPLQSFFTQNMFRDEGFAEYFCEKVWPETSPDDLPQIFRDFSSRQQQLGLLRVQDSLRSKTQRFYDLLQ